MKSLRIIFKAILISLAVLPLFGCKKVLLETPTNVMIDEDNNLIWDKNKSAKLYNIEFKYVDDGTVTQETSRKNSFSLNNLKEGDYEITVQAVPSAEKVKPSLFSDPLTYHKYYETGCTYKLVNNNTEYQITKVGRASGTFEIEDYYRGKAVTSIGDKAFKGSNKVIGITIGKNVESIGEYAFFNCGSLENITIPESVRTIGYACFSSCKSLKEVIIPTSIVELPESCFAYCRSMDSLTLHDDIKTIGSSCFQDCSSLVELTLPENLIELGEYAFFSNTSLKKVKIGSHLKTIGDSTFYSCEKLEEIEFSESSSLESLGYYAFSKCPSLDNLVLPGGLKEIDDYCFQDSSLLNSIKIPETVSHVGEKAFENTKLYKEAKDRNDDFIYADNWMIEASYNTLVSTETITTDSLLNTIIGIADKVFMGAPNLKSVSLPSSFKYIGEYAFAGCSKLWKLKTIDDSVEIIGNYAFAECVLTNVFLGIGLKRIGDYAFAYNPGLDNNQLNQYDWIPDTVNSIGKNAFYGTMIWSKKKGKTGSNAIVYAGNWVVGCTAKEIGSAVLTFSKERVAGISDYAFAGTDVSAVSGLADAKYLGVGAFSNCKSLINVSLNRALTEIRENTFKGCTGLMRAILPKTLKSIGNYAFYACTSLNELELSSTNCESIGDCAFEFDENLQTLTFSKQTKTIGEKAFYGCNRLKDVVFTASIEKIGDFSFAFCDSLENLTVNEKLEKISDYAFYKCISLDKLEIPSSVKTVGRSAFYGCENLKELKINEGVIRINDYAFYQSSKVSELSIPISLEYIGNGSFMDLGVNTLFIPKTLRSIGQHAFYGCANLTIYTDSESLLPNWHERFNSFDRPIFFGCEFNGGSLTSVLVKDSISQNLFSGNIKIPSADGMEFDCFVDSTGATYDLETIMNFKNDSDYRLSLIYVKKASGDSEKLNPLTAN